MSMVSSHDEINWTHLMNLFDDKPLPLWNFCGWKYDYLRMKKYREYIVEELIMRVFHPKRIMYISQKYNIDADDLLDIYS